MSSMHASQYRFRKFVTFSAMVSLLVGMTALADEPRERGAVRFDDRDAAAAQRRHERQVRDAREEYYDTMIDAKEDYVRELRRVLNRVGASSVEGEKINREIDETTEEIARLERERRRGGWGGIGGGVGRPHDNDRNREIELDVMANRGWQEMVEVRRGDVLVVEASGKWTGNRRRPQDTWFGPEGLKGGNGLLQGRVGQGEAFAIGAGREIRVQDDGMLMMRMNDTEYEDNAGYVTVKIRFTRTGDRR